MTQKPCPNCLTLVEVTQQLENEGAPVWFKAIGYTIMILISMIVLLLVIKGLAVTWNWVF